MNQVGGGRERERIIAYRREYSRREERESEIERVRERIIAYRRERVLA